MTLTIKLLELDMLLRGSVIDKDANKFFCTSWRNTMLIPYAKVDNGWKASLFKAYKIFSSANSMYYSSNINLCVTIQLQTFAYQNSK